MSHPAPAQQPDQQRAPEPPLLPHLTVPKLEQPPASDPASGTTTPRAGA